MCPSSPPPAGEISPEEKLLLARRSGGAAELPPLVLLVSLTSAPEEEVRRVAEQTLHNLPDEHLHQALASPSLEESVTQYFLDPARIRPSLLPVLLSNPACPEEAVTRLAAQAGPEVLPALLEQLDLLKTSALLALKENPAYQRWQGAPAPETAALSKEEKLALARTGTEPAEDLSLPVLIFLTSDPDEDVRQVAEQTLHNLPDELLVEPLASLSLEGFVGRYFLDPAHVRPSLLPILLSNPACPERAVTRLVAQAGPEILPALLEQLDLLKTSALLALKENSAYLGWQKEPPPQGLVLEVDLLEMLIQEMETESLSPREVGESEEAEEPAPVGGAQAGMVRKVAKMSVAQRVKLALLGSREERALLVRDSSKVVTRAVLSSPKLTESEVESFAALRNVSQEVLRLISMNRKFMKNYTVVKNLASNPRLPIDIGLTLLGRLIPNDLRGVANSKEVPDTIRKVATKLYKAKHP